MRFRSYRWRYSYRYKIPRYYYPKDIIQCVLYCIIFDLEKFGLYLAKTGYLCLFILTKNDMKTFKDLFCDAITERGRKIKSIGKKHVKAIKHSGKRCEYPSKISTE